MQLSKGQVKFVDKDKSLFFLTLKKRVEAYFTENNISRNYNSTMVTKTIVLLSAYIIPFILLLVLQPSFGISMLLWGIMGLSMAGVGMSVMHDANHGSYSENQKINTLLSYTLNLLGGSVVNWKLQHNQLHHTYTNISGLDEDIDDKVGMRFSPHTPLHRFQRLQFIYAFFFYGIITLYWVTVKDFTQFARYVRTGVNNSTRKKNTIAMLKIVVMKLAYFFVLLVVPTLFFHIPFLEIAAGFLLLHFLGGLILSVVFQLAHTVEGTTHPMPNDDGAIENNWAIHQLNTTVNFSRHNKLLSWYVGGLNFQVEHHLFPRICHVHYPKIAPIVRQTAEEFGIPYLENETFGSALLSHITMLKRFGSLPSAEEILMG